MMWAWGTVALGIVAGVIVLWAMERVEDRWNR